MQLYKSRGFNEFFQDTFTFLKSNGKHFFKHYLIINGFFLILMMVIMYFFTKFYTSILFGGLMGNDSNEMDIYLNDNSGMSLLLAFVFLVVALVAGIISFAFVPIYLKLYAERESQNFGTSELVIAYKTNLTKLFIFLICGFILGIPLTIMFGIGAFILIITIVGMLLIPVLIGAFSLIYNMTLMEYLEERRGIWDSFGYAWTLLSSKFWPAVGCVGLFFLMSYIVQSMLSLIPYVFGMASLFTTIESGSTSTQDVGSIMTLMILILFFISFFVGALLTVVVQLNQGIVFYSLKEDNENINTKNIIDQIGSGE